MATPKKKAVSVVTVLKRGHEYEIRSTTNGKTVIIGYASSVDAALTDLKRKYGSRFEPIRVRGGGLLRENPRKKKRNPTMWGTSYFPSKSAAFSNYAAMGVGRAEVLEKIKDGEIHIGKPRLKANESLKLIDRGTRYAIVEGKSNPVSRRKNISQGFYSGGVFHPIRSASDYDPTRVASEKKALKGRKKRKPAKARKTKATSTTRKRLVRAKKKTKGKVKRVTGTKAKRAIGFKKKNPSFAVGDFVVYKFRDARGTLRSLTGKVRHVGKHGLTFVSHGGQPGFPRGKLITLFEDDYKNLSHSSGRFSA